MSPHLLSPVNTRPLKWTYIANIHYDVTKTLIFQDNFYKKKRIILSGILRSQARDITGMLARSPVNILKNWEHNGTWHTFCGEIY